MNSKENINTTAEKEIVPESFKELRTDIEKGECGYAITTKTNVGEEFKGYTRKEGDDVRDYIEASEKGLSDELKNIIRHSPGIRSLIDFIKIDKFGNASISLSPLSQKKELVAHLKGELCRFSMEYQNNSAKFEDNGRAGSTCVDFIIKKELGEKIINNIIENTDNFTDLIKYLEPRLLDVAPMSDESYYAKAKGIAIFKEEKGRKLDYNSEPVEILRWNNKTESEQSNEVFSKNTEKGNREDVVNLQKEDKRKTQEKITEIRTEIEKEKPKSENFENKEEFIRERLDFILRGGLATGKIPYELPKELYKIEKKGLLSRKHIVKTYGEVNREFKNREEAEAFVREKLEERAIKDLGNIWEKLQKENEN